MKLGYISGDYKIIEILSKNTVEVECLVCKNIRILRFNKFKKMKNNHSGTFCHDTFYYSLLGSIVNDFELISFKKDKQGYIYKCKCIICNLEKDIFIQSIYSKKGTSHKYCHGHKIREFDNTISGMLNFKSVYLRMRRRTTIETHQDWPSYGGRGISSEYYKDFNLFYQDQWESYSEAKVKFEVPSIERIDVNGNYEKNNICWIEMITQAKNRRNNKNFKAISPTGDIFYSKVISDFAFEHNLSSSNVGRCLRGQSKQHLGWTFEYMEDQ